MQNVDAIFFGYCTCAYFAERDTTLFISYTISLPATYLHTYTIELRFRKTKLISEITAFYRKVRLFFDDLWCGIGSVSRNLAFLCSHLIGMGAAGITRT